MEFFRKKAVRKVAVVSLISVILFACLLTRAAKVQLTDSVVSQKTYDAALGYTARVYKESAARGCIYDRNGVPLVTNAYTYAVTLDYYSWDKSAQNENILTLCGLLTQQGADHYDSLAISEDAPFRYVTSSENYSALEAYCQQRKWDIPENAADLLELMADRYKIPAEWDLLKKRTVCGVRYEMERSAFSSVTPFTLSDELSNDVVSVIAEQSTFIPGVAVTVNYKRQYNTGLAAHILGRVGKIYKEDYEKLKAQGYSISDIVGNSGVEKAFEQYLRATDGVKTVLVNSEGRIVEEYYDKEPVAGQSVYLTIDIKMQEVAEKALAETIESIKAQGEKTGGSGADAAGGAVVVIDVNTGEILAIASYPTYDLSTFSRDYSALLEDELAPMFNRALFGTYAPGSTFKMVTSMAALEEGVITPSTVIEDKGVYTYYAPSYTPGCWIWNSNHTTHGVINVAEAIKFSCNYFFYEVGRLLGIDRINKYASLMGLGQKTGIEIGESTGNLAGPEHRRAIGGAAWRESEAIQAAIGQADETFTPIQLANYVATLVNGGTRYRTHLLYSTASPITGDVIVKPSSQVLSEVELSDVTVETIKKGMKGVTTENGTASGVFRDFPITVGGKTGSAQVNGHSANGVFVSFAPYESPEIAVCVIGEFAGSGGSIAPISKAIYNYYFGLE